MSLDKYHHCQLISFLSRIVFSHLCVDSCGCVSYGHVSYVGPDVVNSA